MRLHVSTSIIGHLQAVLQLSLQMLYVFVNSIVRRPEDDLLLRSKHVASHVIKAVVLNLQSVLYFTGTLVAHGDVFCQKKSITMHGNMNVKQVTLFRSLQESLAGLGFDMAYGENRKHE